jgi:hypothetical protein
MIAQTVIMLAENSLSGLTLITTNVGFADLRHPNKT